MQDPYEFDYVLTHMHGAPLVALMHNDFSVNYEHCTVDRHPEPVVLHPFK